MQFVVIVRRKGAIFVSEVKGADLDGGLLVGGEGLLDVTQAEARLADAALTEEDNFEGGRRHVWGAAAGSAEATATIC